VLADVLDAVPSGRIGKIVIEIDRVEAVPAALLSSEATKQLPVNADVCVH
jgi:hypothetical protein